MSMETLDVLPHNQVDSVRIGPCHSMAVVRTRAAAAAPAVQVPRAVQAVQVEQVEQAAQVPRAVQAVQVAQVPRAVQVAQVPRAVQVAQVPRGGAGGAGAEGGAGGAGAEAVQVAQAAPAAKLLTHVLISSNADLRLWLWCSVPRRRSTRHRMGPTGCGNGIFKRDPAGHGQARCCHQRSGCPGRRP